MSINSKFLPLFILIAGLAIGFQLINKYFPNPSSAHLTLSAPGKSQGSPQAENPHARQATTSDGVVSPSQDIEKNNSVGIAPHLFEDLIQSIAQTSELTTEQEQWAFDLSEEQQQKVAQDYHRVPTENRSARGVRVYLLIQQKVTSPATQSFLKEVLQEPRCLSLDDCSSRSRSKYKLPNRKAEASKGALHDRDHSVPQATLDYPQLMVLKGIELNGRKWPVEEKTRWIETLTELRSKNPEWASKYDNALRALQN